MTGALLTTLCFAVTAICAQRAAQLVGSTQANAMRLALAVVVLGAWAHAWGGGLGGAGLGWFLLSGLAGFGVGGWAMFQSLPRLGASLSMLVVQCGSVLVAALGERLWLGQALSGKQWTGIVLTVVGLACGLAPRVWPLLSPGNWIRGLCWALLSAAGQGWGAVLSRKAFAVARLAGAPIDPGTAAYQRALAGLAFGLCMWCVAALLVDPVRCEGSSPAGGATSWSRAWPWIGANAFTGPILGVVCFQWALRSLPAGSVQSVVATSPLATIPLEAWLGGRWPARRYYWGASLAVTGIVIQSL